MVRTRAARKRGAEDLEEEAPPVAIDCIDLTASDDDDEEPKSKRQRRTRETTNKGRAFQPLNHNVAAKVKRRTSRRLSTMKTNSSTVASHPPAAAARVVSEQPTSKPLKVTKTAHQMTTASKVKVAPTAFSTSLRNKKAVPIKTPATEPGGNHNNSAATLNNDTTLSTRKGGRSTRASRQQVDNIDARDEYDPQSVTAYVDDIYENYRAQEEEHFVSEPLCSVTQPFITERMRTILVDWILEVHYKFKLNPQTLYLAISILDRYLHKTIVPVTRRDLQLVGITSLLIAAKYEEMYVPELRDLAYICDGAYAESQVRPMLRM